MSDGGKGSAPRPFSVSQEEYDNRWDNIFGRDKPKQVTPEDNTGTSKNEYLDILTTEDALVEVRSIEEHITATKDMSNLLNK
jgi:hypothetical protein